MLAFYPVCVCVRVTGDSEHKPYICGDADHAAFPLDGSEDYLILACDGFYDTVSPDEAVRIVTDHLTENAGDTAMVAHKLVACARDAGSSDNITVIVVFLRDPRLPPPPLTPADQSQAMQEAEGLRRGEEQEGEGPQGQGGVSGELGCRGDGEGGGKGRGGWPLQQCSAPADLGYEDRTDSFTDRTSLSTSGLPEPPLGVGGNGGASLRLPSLSQKPPVRAFGTPRLLGGAWRAWGEEEEGLCAYRSGGPIPSPERLQVTPATPLPIATLLLAHGDRRRRRLKRMPLRGVGPIRRLLPVPPHMLLRQHLPPLGGALPPPLMPPSWAL